MGFRVTDAFRASPTQHHDCWLDLRARLTELADEPARATAHQVRRVRRQLRFDRHVERVLQRLVREARRSPSRMRRRAQRAGRYTAAGEKLRQSGGDTRAGKGVRGGGGGGGWQTMRFFSFSTLSFSACSSTFARSSGVRSSSLRSKFFGSFFAAGFSSAYPRKSPSDEKILTRPSSSFLSFLLLLLPRERERERERERLLLDRNS